MIRKHYDKILLGLALVILLAAFALAAFQPAPKSITEFVDIPSLRPENTYEVSAMPEPDLSVPEWDAPGAQSAGVEWVFDAFTPPVIYFNPRSETFTVMATDEPPPPPWPIELATIREELYRLQLRGWIGDEGDYRISIENRETGQLLLAREGQEYDEQDFTVRSFTVESGSSAGGTSVRGSVGRAVIYDERLDREVTLLSHVRTRSDESTGHFRVTASPDQTFTAGEGESFSYGDFTYTVEEIVPPARADVTRTGGGEDPETKTFVAKEPAGGGAAQTGATGTGSANTSGAEDPDF